jgi:hypothetical protein
MRSGGRPFCDCDSRAHGRERSNDALHGTARERFIARHFAGEFLPRQMPLNMRMVDPELPQSSERVGAVSAAASLHGNRMFAASLRSHFTPNERRQPSVLAQSAPVE